MKKKCWFIRGRRVMISVTLLTVHTFSYSQWFVRKNKKLKSVCGDLPVIVDSVGVHHQACLRKWKEKQLSRNWFK